MPTSSAGKANSNRAPRGLPPVLGRRRGVTLIELVIVMAIIGVIVAVSIPSVTAGIDSVRLSSATNSVASFLNFAVTRAERRQQPLEVAISVRDNLLTLFANDGATRQLTMPDGVTIEAVLPLVPNEIIRRVILIPGATIPGVGVQLVNRHGSRRIVRLDPMTGFPNIESVNTK